jgi:hypothetical protein
MAGYFINITLAAMVATASYQIKWWLPAIIFPVWILVSRFTPLPPEKFTQGRVYAMRWWFYILATAYMIGQAIIFHIHVGSWFGWIIGLIIGWIAAGVIAGKLEPKLAHQAPL